MHVVQQTAPEHHPRLVVLRVEEKLFPSSYDATGRCDLVAVPSGRWRLVLPLVQLLNSLYAVTFASE